MATTKRTARHRLLTGPDLRELKKLAGVSDQELANRLNLAYWTVVNMQRPERRYGRVPAMRFLTALVSRPKKTKPTRIEPAILNELREQGRERAMRRRISELAIESIEIDQSEQLSALEKEQELRYWRMRIAEDPSYWDRTLESWDDYVNRLANTEP